MENQIKEPAVFTTEAIKKAYEDAGVHYSYIENDVDAQGWIPESLLDQFWPMEYFDTKPGFVRPTRLKFI